MKTIIGLDGISVEVADNTPVKTVNGIHYELSSADLAEIATKESIYVANKVKRDALKEIQRLESKITCRRLREATLGIDQGWLENQENLITIERAKL